MKTDLFLYTGTNALGNKASKRIASIDFFRVVAVIAVIFIHTDPFAGDYYNTTFLKIIRILINQSARFAVPFFFLISGFFIGKKLQTESPHSAILRYYTKRLLTIFIFWSFIYLALPTRIDLVLQHGYLSYESQKFARLMSQPWNLLFEGTRTHLWFMFSLLLAIWLIFLSLHFGLSRKYVLSLAILLYLFGLVAGSYSTTPWGITITFNTRNGPFFSLLFVTIGWFLASEKYALHQTKGIVLAFVGLGIHITEVFVLWKFFKVNPIIHDFLIGTILFATGILLFLLSKPDLLSASNISKFGKYTLGVYASHFIFIDLIKPIIHLLPPYAKDIGLPLTVYGLAVVLSVVFSKNSYLQRFVL